MKNLYLIGGTMGIGKTTVCRELNRLLPNSVFLDGDWCWYADPFQVNDETKTMVLQNIRFLLNQFLHCSAYENIVFCWVMHMQSIIDAIQDGLDISDCCVRCISLVCSEGTLQQRLQKDIDSGIRSADIVERSTERMPLYQILNTEKINVDEKSVLDIAQDILRLNSHSIR